MSVTTLCQRLSGLCAGRSLLPRTLRRPATRSLYNSNALYSRRSALLHTSRHPLADDDASKPTSPPSPDSSADQPSAASPSPASKLAQSIAWFATETDADDEADPSAAATSTVAASSESETDGAAFLEELEATYGSVDFKDRVMMDPTLFSENLRHIAQRLERDQPITNNQQIVLLQRWLDILNTDPQAMGIHPALTWTHPKGKDERPGREAPMMEEQFVPVEYDRREVDRLRLEQRRRERRGGLTEYEAERRAYAMKVSDVRRAYLAEWRAVKQRRDEDILRQWRATKAAAAQRRQQTAEAHKADESETERLDEERYQEALQQRRQRLEGRVRREMEVKKRRATLLLQLFEERKAKGVNHSTDASWGVRIDETLFAQANKQVVGFWPSGSMGMRDEQ